MADSCVPHIIAVKMPNNNASKSRKMRKMVVAAGENTVHSVTQWRATSMLIVVVIVEGLLNL